MPIEQTFIYGVILALGLILPLGPQNAFVLSQGINNKNLLQAAAVAATAALSDTLLITLAVSGLSFIILKMAWLKDFILIGGVIFLIYLGFQFWKKTSFITSTQTDHHNNTKTFKLIGIALLLSLLNPYALIDTTITIGTVSLSYTGIDKYAFALGCITTSWLWFFFLIFIGKRLDRFDFIRKYETKAAAVIIWLAAGYLCYEFLTSYFHH